MSAREQARALAEQADAELTESLRQADADVAAARAALDQAMAARAGLIARAIEDEGWTQRRIATELGVSMQRVSQIKRGR